VPRLMIERRSSRTWPTFDISISSGSETTAA
jgi:hypothetical protein